MSRFADDDLARAVAGARSWRGVLRSLGLPPQSSSALRAVRQRADALGLDHGHFTGQRRWSDADLADAVRRSLTWSEVQDRLGLASTSRSSQGLVRSHAARLGLPVDHLATSSPPVPASPFAEAADLRHLDRAGPLLAASWFTLRGYDVAWPLEPCRYDLIVTRGSQSWRVQVKTTTSRSGGSWAVRISSTRRQGTAVYSPDEVDYFFVLDGDLTPYLIPLSVVGGYQVIRLRRYAAFVVSRQGLDAAG